MLTAESWRKVKALFLLAITAGAEVRTIHHEARFRAGPRVSSSKANGAGVNLAHEQMESMMKGMFGDSSLQGSFAKQIEAMLADPEIQEQGEAFAKRMQAVQAAPNLEEQAKLFGKEMEALEADEKFQMQEKQLADRMDAVMAEPGMKEKAEQATAFAKQMEAKAKHIAEQFETMAGRSEADENAQDPAKLIADQLKALMSDPSFKGQAEMLEGMMSGMNTGTAEKQFADAMKAMTADPTFQKQADLEAEKLEDTKASPEFQKEQQNVANKMQAVMADPKFQEQAQVFAQMMQGGTADAHPAADQLKIITEKMETLMGDSSFQEQAEQFTQQIEAMMAADPKLQEQAERLGAQMEAMMGNLEPEEEHADEERDADQDLVDNLVDKMFDRVAGASPYHQGLDTATLGKSATVANPASRAARHAVLPIRSSSQLARGGLKRHMGYPLTRTPWMPSPNSPKDAFMLRAMDGAVPAPEEPQGFLAKLKANMPATSELKKMLPLSFIFFNILFCYTVLRDTKDVLVVTSGGAEVIPFLKTYMNLPAAIGFTAVYAAMVNRMSNKKIFYTIISGFAIFFASFATIIYPHANALHPVTWANNAAAALPKGLTPIISIIKFWTFGTFYTFAELWGSVVVSVLFWGFANEISSVSEAKRWYPLFGLIANVALIFSGQFIRIVSSMRANLPPGVDAWGFTLNILMTAVVAGAMLVLGTYWFMQNKVLNDPEVMPQDMEKKGPKKKKPSMGLGESFKYLLSSSYIRNLAFLVIAYGTSINIVEVTWKGKLKQAFPGANEYSAFMGAFSSSTGAITLVMMLIGRWILNRFGWGVAALVTPTMLGITGITFFSLILFPDAYTPLGAVMGLTPLMMAVLMGAAQNILSKASKYSLFDPCKETAYIPLDAEMRTKGKAAIDVIGNPLGKSGGAFVQQGALLACGSLAASAPFLGGVLVTMVGLWITAAGSLAIEFEEKAAAMEGKALPDTDSNSTKTS